MLSTVYENTRCGRTLTVNTLHIYRSLCNRWGKSSRTVEHTHTRTHKLEATWSVTTGLVKRRKHRNYKYMHVCVQRQTYFCSTFCHALGTWRIVYQTVACARARAHCQSIDEKPSWVYQYLQFDVNVQLYNYREWNVPPTYFTVACELGCGGMGFFGVS